MIPKGEYLEGENPEAVARREFKEETSCDLTSQLQPLTPLKQPGGKIISAWAVEGDLDPATLKSNTFSLGGPPRSGKTEHFPEVDRGAWFDLPTAQEKMLADQQSFLEQLLRFVKELGLAPRCRDAVAHSVGPFLCPLFVGTVQRSQKPAILSGGESWGAQSDGASAR